MSNIERYNDTLLEAIDTVISYRLQDLPYDQTIVCTVINDEQKDKGIYTVSDGSTTFEAESESEKYSTNQSVLVLIPSGDMTQKKRITGRYISSDEEKPLTYVPPLEQVAELTSTKEYAQQLGIEANSTETYKSIGQWNELYLNSKIYDTFCIQADFQTLFDADVMRSGRFGILAVLSLGYEAQHTFTNGNTFRIYINNKQSVNNIVSSGAENEIFEISFPNGVSAGTYNFSVKKEDDSADEYQILRGTTDITITIPENGIGYFKYSKGVFTQLPSNEEDIYLQLDSAQDMFGNPYGYSMWLTQQQAYKLSGVNKIIKKVELYLYQDADFKYNDGTKESAVLPLFGENIFVKNVKVYFGTDVSQVTDKTVKIFTNDNLNYTGEQEKNVSLVWYNKGNGNKYIGFKDEEKGKISYSVKWYIDNKNGQLEEVTIGNEEGCTVKTNPSLSMTDVKAIITRTVTTKEKVIENDKEVEKDVSTSTSYESNIISFSNLADKAHYVANTDITLQIENSENSYDAYPFYGEDYRLLDPNQASKIRKAKVSWTWSKGILTPDFWDGAKIKWSSNGMIELLNSYRDKETSIEDGEKFDFTCQYRIPSIYSNNSFDNSITCTITKDGQEFVGKKMFVFSTQGTSGTDYTIIVKPKDDRVFGLITGNETTDNFEGKVVDLKGESLDNTVSLEAISGLGIDNYNVIKATAQVEWAGQNVTLESLYPVCYSEEGKYYSDAPTKFLYDSFGKLQHVTKAGMPFYLYDMEGEKVSNVSWSLQGATGKSSSPQLKPINGIYTIIPPMNYVEHTSKPYLVAKINGAIVWSSPIIMQQYKYESEILNNWDGKLQINEEGNYILAAAASFGAKETDNAFSGVLIGKTATINGNNTVDYTGILGYNHGVQTFGLKNDGSFFFKSKNDEKIGVFLDENGNLRMGLKSANLSFIDDKGNASSFEATARGISSTVTEEKISELKASYYCTAPKVTNNSVRIWLREQDYEYLKSIKDKTNSVPLSTGSIISVEFFEGYQRGQSPVFVFKKEGEDENNTELFRIDVADSEISWKEGSILLFYYDGSKLHLLQDTMSSSLIGSQIDQSANQIRMTVGERATYYGETDASSGAALSTQRVNIILDEDEVFPTEIKKGMTLSVKFTNGLNLTNGELKFKIYIGQNGDYKHFGPANGYTVGGSTLQYDRDEVLDFVYVGDNTFTITTLPGSKIVQTAEKITSEIVRAASYYCNCTTGDEDIKDKNGTQKIFTDKSGKTIGMTGTNFKYIQLERGDYNALKKALSYSSISGSLENNFLIQVFFNYARKSEDIDLYISLGAENNDSSVDPIMIDGQSWIKVSKPTGNKHLTWDANTNIVFEYDSINKCFKLSSVGVSKIAQTASQISLEVGQKANYYCTTDAAEAGGQEKKITYIGFPKAPKAGLTMTVLFPNGNSYNLKDGPLKLRIYYVQNGSIVKDVTKGDATCKAGDTIDFVYNGTSFEVTSLPGSRITQTKESIELLVKETSDIKSEIKVLPRSISLSTQDGGTSASITLNVDGKEQTSTIKMTGLVSFSNLKETGKTEINGANIQTGTINADRIIANTLTIAKIKGGTNKENIVFEGSIEAKNITATGTINATSGKIGNWKVVPNADGDCLLGAIGNISGGSGYGICLDPSNDAFKNNARVFAVGVFNNPIVGKSSNPQSPYTDAQVAAMSMEERLILGGWSEPNYQIRADGTTIIGKNIVIDQDGVSRLNGSPDTYWNKTKIIFADSEEEDGDIIIKGTRIESTGSIRATGTIKTDGHMYCGFMNFDRVRIYENTAGTKYQMYILYRDDSGIVRAIRNFS